MNSKHKAKSWKPIEFETYQKGVCGKVCYSSRGQAKASMKSLISSGRHKDRIGVLNVYKCNI